jgi:hypothetical protein
MHSATQHARRSPRRRPPHASPAAARLVRLCAACTHPQGNADPSLLSLSSPARAPCPASCHVFGLLLLHGPPQVSKFTIKSDYGYGDSGSPPKIPGGATLVRHSAALAAPRFLTFLPSCEFSCGPLPPASRPAHRHVTAPDHCLGVISICWCPWPLGLPHIHGTSAADLRGGAAGVEVGEGHCGRRRRDQDGAQGGQRLGQAAAAGRGVRQVRPAAAGQPLAWACGLPEGARSPPA